MSLLDNLKAAGAFTGVPVKKQVVCKINGKDFAADVYVRPLSFHSAVADIISYTNKADAVDSVAGRIAASICDKDGKPVFTVADITGEADPTRGPLDGNLTMALLNVISEVNQPAKTQRSPRNRKSGTN